MTLGSSVKRVGGTRTRLTTDVGRGLDKCAGAAHSSDLVWGRGEAGYRAGLSSRRPRVQVPSLPSTSTVTGCGAVASALGSGPRGREFESPQPDSRAR